MMTRRVKKCDLIHTVSDGRKAHDQTGAHPLKGFAIQSPIHPFFSYRDNTHSFRRGKDNLLRSGKAALHPYYLSRAATVIENQRTFGIRIDQWRTTYRCEARLFHGADDFEINARL